MQRCTQTFRNVAWLLRPFSVVIETHAFCAEEALRLLIVVATNRFLFGGLSPEAIAEEWVIARLACGPLPFSEITKYMPESVSQLRSFQAIVERVATFQKPKGVPRS